MDVPYVKSNFHIEVVFNIWSSLNGRYLIPWYILRATKIRIAQQIGHDI